RLPTFSRLAQTARAVPVLVAACGGEVDPGRRAALTGLGVGILAAETHEGHLALPELLEDLGAQGMSTLMVEGGAQTARQFLADDLVDRIALFTGPASLGPGGIASPVGRGNIPSGFRLIRQARFGPDDYQEYVRVR